jgi:hypothetical protein
MPNNLDAAIQSIVARASTDIARLVRDSIADELRRVVGGSGLSARRGGRPAGSVNQAKGQKGGRKGGRRGAGPSESDLQTVHDFISRNPGLRSEEIQKKIGGEPDLVRKALAKLRASGQAKTKGAKRATTYFSA